MPSRLSAVLAVCGTAVLLAGCTASVLDGHPTSVASGQADSPASSSGATGASHDPVQPPANFADCSDRIDVGALGLPADRTNKLSFECATISVPLNYADPNGQHIDLTLLKIHDSDNTASEGSLLVNPGGPGGSGLDLALGLAGQLPTTVLTHFDVVGFDPRGVGASSPIECLSDAEKDTVNAASPDIRTTGGFTQARSIAKMIADKCSAKYGSALQYYNTVETAHDLDQIREAVGDTKLNYLGFSYGTELGAQYVHLFPQTVGVAVLDGAVDPLTSDITSFADQLQGFESAFDQFATWCRSHSPCRSLGNPRQAVYALQARAKSAAIPTSASGDKRKATPAVVDTGVLSALYSQARWPTLGNALIQARHGNSQGIFALADDYNERLNGHYTNLSDANTAISCNDSKPGPTNSTIRATTASWVKRFPIFGLWSAASLFSCQQWQPHRTVPPKPTATDAAHKVLVIGNLHDPATPYQGAKDLTSTLGDAELLTWNGEGHTSYLQGSSCIDDYVNSYLVGDVLPPVGKVCPR